MEEISVPVLIIGGGGCGLSSSIFLSEYGVKSLLVERHATSGRLPKARYLSQRTMEIFRQYGVADAIYAKSFPLENISQVRWCTTLGGDGPLDRREFHRIDSFGGGGQRNQYQSDGPSESTLYPQVRLEPLLSQEAQRRNPGGVLYSHELQSLEQTADGVVAIIEDRTNGNRKRVNAQYLIAADGGRSVGPIVGSRLEGDRKLTDMVTVYFRADLSQWVDDDRTFTQWFVNPDGGSWGSGVLGKLGPTRFDRHSEEWMFHFSFRPDDPARFDESSLVPRMRDLMKIPDFTPDIIGIGHWEVEGVLADRYRFGRVFLAGDAAHRHPPTTGLGLNSAVHDAQNLCWKLAAVLGGTSPDSLLDTYEQERRPVAYRNVRWALMTFGNHQMTDAGIGLVRGNAELSKANFAKFFADDEEGETRRARLREVVKVQRMEWQAHDLELGFHYPHGAVVPDGTQPPARDPMGVIYTPTTRPGHRLPHAWIDAEETVSTHDLAGRGFVLIIGSDGEAWRSAAADVSARLNVPIKVVSIGEGGDYPDPSRKWLNHREIGNDGAILVRPDNHVAWRAKSAREAPESHLLDALQKVLFMDGVVK